MSVIVSRCSVVVVWMVIMWSTLRTVVLVSSKQFPLSAASSSAAAAAASSSSMAFITTTTTRRRPSNSNNKNNNQRFIIVAGRIQKTLTVSYSSATTSSTPSSPLPREEDDTVEDATTTLATTRTTRNSNSNDKNKKNDADYTDTDETEEDKVFIPPWNNLDILERATNKSGSSSSNFRARQHVNPLARRFQQPTLLTEHWPRDMFTDLSRPLFLDIGCSRGGFLVEMASQQQKREQNQQEQEKDTTTTPAPTTTTTTSPFVQKSFNYLGLEIRPIVVHQAQERVAKHQLDGILGFVGCNANVDLERLLTIYCQQQQQQQQECKDSSMMNLNLNLDMVTIQFPDPHFKSHHAKRRVVTTRLVTTLAQFMKANSTVFLQSDVAPVLEDMRLKFQEQGMYFVEQQEELIHPVLSLSQPNEKVDNDNESTGQQGTEKEIVANDYSIVPNPIGIPTEREISVLDRGLPVYRVVFRRTATPVQHHDDDDEEKDDDDEEE